MANARGKEIDTSHLPAMNYIERQILHRDILGHHLRWTHIAKYIRQGSNWKGARVLDIGCGIDLPLARMLFANRTAVLEYIGVDYNKASKFDMINFGAMPVHAYGNIDASKHLKVTDKGLDVAGLETHDLPNLVVSLEMLEHSEPAVSRQVCKNIHDILTASSERNPAEPVRAFLSTPCYDAHTGAAKAHVSEITYQALGAMLEDLGFAIVGKWGTFASQKDYKAVFLKEHGSAIWDKLSEYYDSNYIATIFAPLYPHLSRNCLWEVTPAKEGYARQFPVLSEVPGPWTSSDKWEELNG